MKAVQPRLTYPELRMMPDDGKRYELIDGEVFMTPSPSEKHQRVTVNLSSSMHIQAKEHKLGKVYVAPFDVVFAEGIAFQPDILFCINSEARYHRAGVCSRRAGPRR